MKKRTLNQTWTLCLRMWRWIAKVWTPGGPIIYELKVQWLKSNKFGGAFGLKSHCFFCEFQKDTGGCSQCPGVLVNPYFNCYDDRYHHKHKPAAFYKELLRLNRIRKGS